MDSCHRAAGRGHDSIEVGRVPPRYAGTSVHDGLTSYRPYCCDRPDGGVEHFITGYALGRHLDPSGLDRRSRWLTTLTALIARGHHEEFANPGRAARTNGPTDQRTDNEIKELMLLSAIYCGVPDANTAFRIARAVLAELDNNGLNDDRGEN